MESKKLLLSIVLFSATIFSHAQKTDKAKQMPSLAIGTGLLSFKGDVGSGVNLSSLGSIRSGYNLTIEQRFGKYLGVSINGLYGKLSESERSTKRNLNFESKIMQGDLNLVLHFDNDQNTFSPFLFAGIGYLKFESYSDLTDKNNIKYNYWSDGTIRDVSETDASAPSSIILQRDYTYETKLTDSATNYPRSSLAMPIGAGFNFKIHQSFYVNIGATYYLCFTDWIDNYKSGGNDNYIFANLSIQYNFGKQDNENDGRYRSVDFSALDKMDTDEDGVKDAEDRCPSTPKGVKTNGKGCPEDTDEDGVPNYMDEELTTKKDAFVDEKGVTITDKMLADEQLQYDSIATDRNKLIDENPSLQFKVE